MDNLQALTSWLSPTGMLVLILQNENTDCMTMHDHFFQERFQLSSLACEFRKKHGNRYQVRMETVPAHVATNDFDSAYAISEFMLNLLPVRVPPTRQSVENYIRDHFSEGEQGYRFSCHQDFLCISKQ